MVKGRHLSVGIYWKEQTSTKCLPPPHHLLMYWAALL